jgi:endo-1,4-beta-D-glucanase Y
MRAIAPLLVVLLIGCGSSEVTPTASRSAASAGATSGDSLSSGVGGAPSSSSGSGAVGGAGGGEEQDDIAPSTPFASHLVGYTPGSVLPDVVSPAQLDLITASVYDAWKERYLKAGCGDGRYYVETNTQAGNLSLSEGHGYGMMISAIMAGRDPHAKRHFDGLYRFFRDHPSTSSPDLMAWYQDTSCNDAEGMDSASDGDLDIAFALLLADKQWGSCGGIDYRSEAFKVIYAAKDQILDTSHHYVLLGDWVDPGSGKYYDATRSSDMIADHFRSFGALTDAATWTGLVDSSYSVISWVRNTYSFNKGLLPDFIQSPLSLPKPAPADFLQGSKDGTYDYNACRVPWRTGTDYLVSGDARAKAEVQALTAWIEGATGGDPQQIRAGYHLDGTPSPGSNYVTMAFVAPFGVAAMADQLHKPWLDALWTTIAAAPSQGYYEDTLQLLSMIVMSGNWWSPESRPTMCSP